MTCLNWLLHLYSGQTNLTVWNDTYEEEKSNASGSNSVSNLGTPGPSPSPGPGHHQQPLQHDPQHPQQRVAQLQAGVVSSVSPSKSLPLNINIPHQSSPNKFIPHTDCDEALSVQDIHQPGNITKHDWFLAAAQHCLTKRLSRMKDVS